MGTADMAFTGQPCTHLKQSMHVSATLISLNPVRQSSMGQRQTQMPQPTHFSSLISIMLLEHPRFGWRPAEATSMKIVDSVECISEVG